MEKLTSTTKYPLGTEQCLLWNSIVRREEPMQLSERASSRMVRIAANLSRDEWVGWQMIVPPSGLVEIAFFGTNSIKTSDLEWISEESATYEKPAKHTMKKTMDKAKHKWLLYEAVLLIGEKKSKECMGFTDSNSFENATREHIGNRVNSQWPMRLSGQFSELIDTLRIEGAIMRFLVGPASNEEQKVCTKQVESTWQADSIAMVDYLGTPVRARLLFLMPERPSARTLAVMNESIPGVDLRYVGKLDIQETREVWDWPMSRPQILPDYAARIMACEPSIGKNTVIGLQAHEPTSKDIPALHAAPKSKDTLVVGNAIGITGKEIDIALSESDLRRHWQIIGQTGTGKSSLLVKILQKALLQNYGMTFFDPHGTTIDILLKMIPKQHIHRVRVIRIGDLNNPVPINMWNTNDPRKAERTIADMNQLFIEIFDPRREGIVGPRWERIFSLLSFAAIAILGNRASFESISVIARDKRLINKTANAIHERYPDIADSLISELVEDNSHDYTSLIGWFVSKFQRLTSVEQLRNTLGAGANAVDFGAMIDTNIITLVDLALPIIGTNAARVVGTLLLQQLWTAALSREQRSSTHVIAIDEAQLFQTNPLPQMLAEGRKFGLALILAHQHINQLTADVREALIANSANFSAFRLSVKDAIELNDRFDITNVHQVLSRQNAFRALTTLSVDGIQTPAFTLQIRKPKAILNGEEYAETIIKNSIDKLVDPYRADRPINSSEVRQLINRAEILSELSTNDKEPTLLDQWWHERQKSERAINNTVPGCDP